jgi:hypothetical protein
MSSLNVVMLINRNQPYSGTMGTSTMSEEQKINTVQNTLPRRM